MSSHGTVVDHRSGTGVRLRELDDSRRGARFSNRKEEKLLERKLTYLNNQNKRVQISINREKEFIKTRNPKENDKEMNHLDRRYKEAMGFILDYKTTSVLHDEQRKLSPEGTRNFNQSAMTKCRAITRIRSAPSSALQSSADNDMRNKRPRPTKLRKSPHIKDAWLGKRLNKMSIESNSLHSDSESEEEELYRPFSGKLRPKPGSAGASSCSTVSDKRGDISSSKMSRSAGRHPRSSHRINTSVIKNGFWSVLRQNRNNTVTEPYPEEHRRLSMANTARDIMVEQRVCKLFMKVDKLKHPPGHQLPNI